MELGRRFPGGRGGLTRAHHWGGASSHHPPVPSSIIQSTSLKRSSYNYRKPLSLPGKHVFFSALIRGKPAYATSYSCNNHPTNSNQSNSYSLLIDPNCTILLCNSVVPNCGHQTSSSSIIWELVRNACSWALPLTFVTLGVGLRNVCFNDFFS